MKHRVLGHTGLKVSELGFGCGSVGGLLVRGEYDGIATVADLEQFFNQLPNGDRQFIILPGTVHSVALATNRQLFWHVTRSFLTMPTPIAT